MTDKVQKAENTIAVIPYSDEYDYEIGLPSGTTETSLNIETESPDTEVKVEKIDSLASSSNIKRLSATKHFQVSEGDNYHKNNDYHFQLYLIPHRN